VKTKNEKHGKSSKQWWKTVNAITGRGSKEVPLNSLFNLENINRYFRDINADCNYKSPTFMAITGNTRIPVIDEFTAFKFLSNVKRTAAGPDGIQYWFWKEFALELAPVVTHLFNLSIKA
jgi:hypothetical protein